MMAFTNIGIMAMIISIRSPLRSNLGEKGTAHFPQLKNWNTEWYSYTGISLFGTIVIEVLMTHLTQAIFFLYYKGRLFKDRGYSFDKTKTM
jgi:hypothetical protein